MTNEIPFELLQHNNESDTLYEEISTLVANIPGFELGRDMVVKLKTPIQANLHFTFLNQEMDASMEDLYYWEYTSGQTTAHLVIYND